MNGLEATIRFRGIYTSLPDPKDFAEGDVIACKTVSDGITREWVLVNHKWEILGIGEDPYSPEEHQVWADMRGKG